MKRIEDLQKLIYGELEDYSYFDNWEIHYNETFAGNEYYSLDLKANDEYVKTIRFRCSIENGNSAIEVCLGEDHWYETKDYNYTIKYFWMAVLNWDYEK